MEEFLKIDNTAVGICILLTINILMKAIDWYREHQKEKEDSTATSVHELSVSLQSLSRSIDRIEPLVNEIPKFKKDVQRFYTAIKILAGPKWAQISKEILQDDQLRPGGKG